MPSRSIVSCVVLGAALASCSGSELPAPCPYGSFAQTCTNLACFTDRIEAECASQTHDPVDTSLDLPCDTSVSNCNGELTCGECILPPGSYLESCSGCSASSEELTCLACLEQGDRDALTTSIVLPCAVGISNCDGRLTCGACGP